MIRGWIDRKVHWTGRVEHPGSPRPSRRRTPLLVTLGLLVLSACVLSASAVGSPGFVRIELAPRIPFGARAVGAVKPSAPVSGTVVLKPRNNAALTRFIAEVTDRDSPMFHHYLPAGAFATRFGPTKATIAAVRSQLRADGLRVTGISSDGLMMSFKGDSAHIQRAFDTRLETYRLAKGSLGEAATSAIRVPATIAGSVTAVLGLNDLVREQPVGIIRAPASDAGKIPRATTTPFAHPLNSPKACPAATAAAQEFGGLTDDQIANAYGAFGLYNQGDLGAGQHIAIYELEPFLRSDIQTFDTCYFGAAQAASMMSRLHVIPIEGGQPAGPGSGEALLDVEDVSALAPGADIDVYEMPSYGADGIEYDPVDLYAAMVDSDRDQVISTSWGLCEQAVQLGQPGLQQAENLLFEQAAAQGQSVFNAASDTGDDDCNELRPPTPAPGQNPLSVMDPASQPYVVGVGGTTITNAATQPPAEHVWNDGPDGGGGGGGISQSWTMPTWQRDATVPGIALPGSPDYTNANSVESRYGYPPGFCQSTLPGATPTTPCRLVPDVSAQADELTGSITVYSAPYGGWFTIGGTSSATPIWASLVADVNASATCASQPATRNGVGFVSPLLYAVASNPNDYAASFNDITAGNNDIYDLDGGQVFPARRGYDEASGLGSPRLTGPDGSPGLAYYLCSFANSPSRPLVARVSPAFGSTAGGERVTILGRGFESGGASDVAGIQVGNAQIPSADFTVRGPNLITATLPAAIHTLAPFAPAPQDGAGPAQIIVTLRDDESSAPSLGSRFQYVDTSSTSPIPSITGLIPIGGLNATPNQVEILGSGFYGARSVTFGGVPALGFSVDGANRIIAVAPPLSRRTACAPLPSGGVFAGENASNDICQVQVRVSGDRGTSATGHILPPPEGPFAVNTFGVQVDPCACELQPAPTEYDYIPAPRITSVSSSAGPSSYASESGGTVITVHGVGLNPMTIDWAFFGDPTLESSEDISYVYVTGTELQIVAPPEPTTTRPVTIPFSVRTLAGQSPAVPVTYAGSS